MLSFEDVGSFRGSKNRKSHHNFPQKERPFSNQTLLGTEQNSLDSTHNKSQSKRLRKRFDLCYTSEIFELQKETISFKKGGLRRKDLFPKGPIATFFKWKAAYGKPFG